MAKSIFKEDTYQQKLTNTTNLRLLAFFLWKFLIMATLLNTLNYILSLEAIRALNLKFFLGFNPTEIFISKNLFFKIYAVSTIVDWLSIIYYQKYEESLSKSDYFFKLIFLPGYNTIFLFLNFILTTLFLALIEHAFNSRKFKSEKVDVSR